MTKHVLIGGTGAVGSVYGYYLQRGGADVTLFVRPKREAALQKQHGPQPYLLLHDLTARWYRCLMIGLILFVLLLLFLCMIFVFRVWFHVPVALVLTCLFYRVIPVLPAPHIIFTRFHVISDITQLGSGGYSYIWLCISSCQLREPGFIESVTEQLDHKQILVTLTPGLSDVDYIASVWPHRERIVCGTIPVISYQAPLKGERWHVTRAHTPPAQTQGDGARPDRDRDRDERALERELQNGCAVFVPPGSRVFYSGSAAAVQPILDVMNCGGFPSVAVKYPCHHSLVIPQCVLMSFLMALETVDWSWSNIKHKPKLIQTTAQAAQELLFVVHARECLSAPWFARYCMHPLLFHVLMLLAPVVMPFDLEPYIQYHFTKVGSQTVLFGDELLSYARDHDMPHSAIQTLITQVKTTRKHK